MKKIFVKGTPMGSLDCLLSWNFTLTMQLKSVTSTTTKHQVLSKIFGNREIHNCSECTGNICFRYPKSVMSKFKGVLDSLGVSITFLFVYLNMYTHMHTYTRFILLPILHTEKNILYTHKFMVRVQITAW